MEKLTKITGERFIKNQNDAQLAQFGHLNQIIDSLNTLSSLVNVQSSTGINGSLKIITGILTHVQLQNTITNPIVLYNITATSSFIPLGGMIRYVPTTFTPVGLMHVYYNPPATPPSPSSLTSILSIDNLYWNSTPSSIAFNMQFNPASSALSQTSTFSAGHTVNIGFEQDFVTSFITPLTYFIFGIELNS